MLVLFVLHMWLLLLKALHMHAATPQLVFDNSPVFVALTGVPVSTIFYRCAQKDGRNGPPAGNKARCKRTNTPQSTAIYYTTLG
jgi:hypothetical protein